MYRLTMFGGMDLTDSDGHRVQSVLSQPKRLALLAYLALEGRGLPVARDRILAVFWPECDDATARNRLKRAVHFLRRSMGPGVLPRDPSDRLHLDPAAFSADVGDFWAALDAGHCGDALALYQGELLPGFHLNCCLVSTWTAAGNSIHGSRRNGAEFVGRRRMRAWRSPDCP
jgi:DNA-binding SARP family transcriptional activator